MYLKYYFALYVIICLYLNDFMSTSLNRYFLRSAMEQSTQSNIDVNIANNINLESSRTTASEVHFQTTSSSVLPPTSSTLQLL